MDTKELRHRLERIESFVAAIAGNLEKLNGIESAAAPPEVYTAAEFAKASGASLYTVREWLKTGRLLGKRVNVCHGTYREWRIPHEELLRFRREGLREVPSSQDEAEENDESTPKKRKGLIGLDFKRRNDSTPMVDENFVDRRFGPRKPKADDQPPNE